jgi:LysM repeat protein
LEEQVTVRQGETVADLQLQSLLSRNTLQTANPGVDLDALEAGQRLCIPTENTACTLPSTYTLVEGETLESVAMRFNLPLGSLLRVNPCLAPQDFEEGVTVILPR